MASLIEHTKEGEFKRQESQFRDFIRPEDAIAGRYHLYVSYACPWAHRTLIVRKLKKLDDLIAYSVTNPHMGAKGWSFGSGHDLDYLMKVYQGADPNYTGRATVPVLWDNRLETIVNNESADIIRMLNSSFNHLTKSTVELYPVVLRKEIDAINEKVYEDVNEGVYKAGFAANQSAYDDAFEKLFKRLSELDTLLGQQKYLVGDKITEADVRLFTTLVRFDVVYYVHFKCNLRMIREYKNLGPYLRSLYQIPEFNSTCHFDHIKEHYYTSHKQLNPSRIIPGGPELDLELPHERGEPTFHTVSGWNNHHLS